MKPGAFYMRMGRKAAIFGILLILQLHLSAQKGGTSTYSFLGLTTSARVAALGGKAVSILDDDINLVYHNPALLNQGMHNHLSLNYVNYFAGINYGYTSFGYSVENVGNFAAGMHYVDYGTFDRTDELGQQTGTFRASEYALNLTYSRWIVDSMLMAGVSLKPVYSSFEQYNSFGLAMDVGVTYHNQKTLTTVALVARNAGVQITSYTGVRERLPFELLAGITQGLEHAPFRFTVTLQNLERWDLSYKKTEETGFSSMGDEIARSRFDIFGDKLMRHVILGVEFLLGENIHLDLGYNYRRRQEMKVNTNPGMVGFSVGMGFRISKFRFAFGRASYHLAGGTNHISLTTNLSEFYRKR